MNEIVLNRRMLLSGAGALVLSGAMVDATHAQEFRWRTIASGVDAPMARWDHNLAADASRGTLLLFGGRDNDGNALGDTWRFDLESETWSQLDVEAPSARFGSASTVESARNRVWLFGGQAGSDFFNDTWRFDFGAERWRLQHDGVNNAPAPRYGLGAAFTQEAQVVVSHGFTFEGRFDDTWQLDVESKTWTNITPSGDRPLNRCLHEMITLPNDEVMLYGGCSSGFGPCPQGDLWQLDTSSAVWIDVTPASSPSARSNPSVVWSDSLSSALLFGGQTEAGKSADLWSGSPGDDGFTWTSQLPAGTGPAARSSHDAVVIDRTMYVFGGLTDSGAVNDLWALDF